MSAMLLQALASADLGDVADLRACVGRFEATLAGETAGPVYTALAKVLARPTRDVDLGLQSAIVEAEAAEPGVVMAVAQGFAQVARASHSALLALFVAVITELRMAAAAADREFSVLLDDLDRGLPPGGSP